MADHDLTDSVRLFLAEPDDVTPPDAFPAQRYLRTEARKIAGWAEGHFIRTATHNPLGPVMTATCTHFNAACANFGIQEQYDHGPRPDLDEVFTARPVVTPGRAAVPETPGLGVDIDRRAARQVTARSLERPHLQRPDDGATPVAARDDHGGWLSSQAPARAQRRKLAQRRLIGHPHLPAGRQHGLRLGDHAPLFSP